MQIHYFYHGKIQVQSIAKLTEMQLHIINSSFKWNTSYERPLPPLSSWTHQRTAQSSAEAEPTTISAVISKSSLPLEDNTQFIQQKRKKKKITLNSLEFAQLHEHVLQELQCQQQSAHPSSPKQKIDNLRANILV